MSGFQTIVQITALIGFWAAFAINAVLPDTSPAQWQLPVAVQLVPGALMLLSLFAIPETPRFFAERREWDRAAQSLGWLRYLPSDHEDVKGELADIRETNERAEEMAAKHPESFLSEVGKPGIRNRLGVGMGLMLAQNATGQNAINFYAPVIFISAGFTSLSASLFLSGLFGFVKLFSSLAFQIIGVGYKGNRFWLILGSTTCSVTMLALCLLVRALPPVPLKPYIFETFGTLPNTMPGASSIAATNADSVSIAGIFCVLMIYIFTLAFGLSLGPISWNVCSEISPLHINAQCCAITTCTQWVAMGIVAVISPTLIAAIGWVTYIIFGISCFMVLLWCYLFVPETRGVGLGRPMDELFGFDSTADDDEEVQEQPTESTALLEARPGPEGRKTSKIEQILANEHARRKMSLN